MSRYPNKTNQIKHTTRKSQPFAMSSIFAYWSIKCHGRTQCPNVETLTNSTSHFNRNKKNIYLHVEEQKLLLMILFAARASGNHTE